MGTEIVNLEIDVAKCTGCRACELACSFVKESAFSPELSRIRIVQVHHSGLSVPIVCVDCANAPCIPACPVGAIYRDAKIPTVRISAEDCIGCGDCIQACPFGAVDRPRGKDVAIMCDLCDGSPACVPSCVYGALKFDRKDAVAEVKRRATAVKIAARIRQQPEVAR